jgi:hypothetical protein
VHCWDAHLCSQEGVGAAFNLGSSLSHAPSEQTHRQNSRFTPRCPSVVLWTPCSGVEWRVSDPAQGLWASGTTRKQPATWRWRVRRGPCQSSPTTHPPYVPHPKRS